MRFRPRGFGVRVVLTVAAVVFVPAALALLSRETDIGFLTLLGLPLALLLGLWLAWRLLRAINRLRRQALERARTISAPDARVEVDRDDEIGDLAEAFNRLLGTLQERHRSTEAFVADLAHEVKNPIASVRACAEALERGRADEERNARLARVLRTSSERLDRVVTQLLELARIQARCGQRDDEWIDLNRLVDGVTVHARDDERFAGVSIRSTADGDTRVRGDGYLLEAAVRNLVDNAASFSDGEVRVEVRSEETSVTIDVVDDGPGVSEGDRERIFERFFTTRAERGGTGLGLAFVRAIAEAHGGAVLVSSADGRGARFSLCVPRSGVRSPTFHD